MKFIYLFLYLLIFNFAFASAKGVVNVYNWSGYIPAEVLKRFESETGIRINYTTFENNHELYIKLKANPNSGYDIIVPSCSMVNRMRNEHMLQPLNKTKLSQDINTLNPLLLNRDFDPNNNYSLPYLWGTTAIIYHKNLYKNINSWQDLFRAEFKNRIAILDDMRDVFGIAFKILGYSVNDKNPEHIKQAYLKLKSLMPNIRAFTTDGSQQIYINEDVTIGVIQSGNASIVNDENENYLYIYPKEGPMLWIDSVAIPKNAPNLENAYVFINFMLRPEIAKLITEGVRYTSPNLKAISLLTPEKQKNILLNPPPALLNNAEIETDLDNTTQALYLKYWQLLKLEG